MATVLRGPLWNRLARAEQIEDEGRERSGEGGGNRDC